MRFPHDKPHGKAITFRVTVGWRDALALSLRRLVGRRADIRIVVLMQAPRWIPPMKFEAQLMVADRQAHAGSGVAVEIAGLQAPARAEAKA